MHSCYFQVQRQIVRVGLHSSNIGYAFHKITSLEEDDCASYPSGHIPVLGRNGFQIFGTNAMTIIWITHFQDLACNMTILQTYNIIFNHIHYWPIRILAFCPTDLCKSLFFAHFRCFWETRLRLPKAAASQKVLEGIAWQRNALNRKNINLAHCYFARISSILNLSTKVVMLWRIIQV